VCVLFCLRPGRGCTQAGGDQHQARGGKVPGTLVMYSRKATPLKRDGMGPRADSCQPCRRAPHFWWDRQNCSLGSVTCKCVWASQKLGSQTFQRGRQNALDPSTPAGRQVHHQPSSQVPQQQGATSARGFLGHTEPFEAQRFSPRSRYTNVHPALARAVPTSDKRYGLNPIHLLSVDECEARHRSQEQRAQRNDRDRIDPRR